MKITTVETIRVKEFENLLWLHVHTDDGLIGLGETFDGDKVRAYPPGSVIVLPGETWHFHWAKSGEYVTQVTAIGPLGLEYHDAHDDPRRRQAEAIFDPVGQRTIVA